ncbi:MAG: HlyC/CorC family transporter, partial [Methanobacteriota archaeon]
MADTGIIATMIRRMIRDKLSAESITFQSGLTDFFLIAFFLALNFFFVASEFAFVRVRITHMTTLANQGSKRAKRVLSIIHDLDRSMSSTQLGISLASIGVGFVAERFFTSILIGVLELVGVNTATVPNLEGIGFVMGYLIGTYLHVVIGELVPKSLAIRFAEQTALICAEPLYWFMKISDWFLVVLIKSANLVLKLFKVPLAEETFTEVYSEDELKLIIENSIESGELEEYESQLIYNIFDFTDTQAKEILTPRYEIKALPEEAPIKDVLQLAKETGHSRFPVYRESLDNVLGFVHIKDALLHYDENNGTSEHTVAEHLRPVITVHEGFPIDDLLKEMQKQQTQVAVVVDEYGSVMGIITIEDILEAIVGPIKDEFDSIEKQDELLTKDQVLLVNGTIPIDEFNELLNKYNIDVEIKPKT